MNVNENMVWDAKLMMSDIASSTDPIEKNLSRTSNRILGGFLGLLTFGIPTGVFVADASVDSSKLQQIQAKKIQLDQVQLNHSEAGYEKAVVAREFQKDVYTSIAGYTQTAEKVKSVLALASVLYGVGAALMLGRMLHSGYTSRSASMTEAMALQSGLLIGLPTAAYGLYHWLVDGSNLEGKKQVLAEQASRRLFSA